MLPTSTCVMCDNINATYTTANPGHYDCAKHIVVDNHFVCERLAVDNVVVRSVPIKLQLVYIFIKGLSSSQFSFLKSNLSLHYAPVHIEVV